MWRLRVPLAQAPAVAPLSLPLPLALPLVCCLLPLPLPLLLPARWAPLLLLRSHCLLPPLLLPLPPPLLLLLLLLLQVPLQWRRLVGWLAWPLRLLAHQLLPLHLVLPCWGCLVLLAWPPHLPL